ncbi:MAG: leucine-rich repeat domain-containing protein [Clostridia bacterium]|nr:leucine-rich repeat domain-containing protein [Clostridia bacterium]
MSESMNKILKVVIIAEAALIAVCMTLTIIFSAVRANSPVTATASASASDQTASASNDQSASDSADTGLADGEYENEEYKYVVSGENCYIKQYIGSNTRVIVPAMIEDKKVTKIGESAFYLRTDIESVSLPDSVTEIGSDAFHNCIDLETVNLGSGLTSIGGFAFFVCQKLQSITIPDSVTSIGEQAFYGCIALETVILGSGVKTIGRRAFLSCISLITAEFKNTSGWSVDGIAVDVTDASQNATMLRETNLDSIWSRSDQ